MSASMGDSSKVSGNSSGDPLTKFGYEHLNLKPLSIVFNLKNGMTHRLEKWGDRVRLGVVHTGDVICAFDFDGTNNLPINRTRCAVWEQ